MSSTQTLRVPATRQMGHARNGALWVLQVATAAILGMGGVLKIAGAPEMIAVFDAVGIGQWFRYVTGALELAGAALLLIPPFAGVGALLLGMVTAGAVLSHLFVIGGSSAMALLWLVVVALIAYGRRERTLRLLGR